MIPNDPTELVPVGLVAAELGEHPDRLARRLAADVVLDDVGLRCLPVAVARELFTQRARRAEARAQQARERAAAAKAKPRRPVHRGVKVEPFEGQTLAEAVIALDGEPVFDGDRRLPRAPSKLDWIFGGVADGGELIGAPRKRGRK